MTVLVMVKEAFAFQVKGDIHKTENVKQINDKDTYFELVISDTWKRKVSKEHYSIVSIF